MDTLTADSKVAGNQLIDEQVKFCKLELVEGEGERKGRVFARGEFGHAAKPTANGRFYRHNIWENNIVRLKPNLESRKVLGELDHPTDGRTALQRASHVITDLQLVGDQVIGEAEILDTSKGRDLKAILAAGVPVGISSRGYGSTKPNRDGIEEVQEDYKLVTFDFVAEPADPTAYPEVVFESSEKIASMMFEGVALEPVESETVSDETEEDEEQLPSEESSKTVTDEQELAKRFAQKVLDGVEGDVVTSEALQEKFAAEIVERIVAMRSVVEKQVRSELESDPDVAGARSTLEQIKQLLIPYNLSEESESLVANRDEEIKTLRSQLEEAESRIETQQNLIEQLTNAAREAGYKYYLERLLYEDDSDTKRLRAIIGDVLQYDSPNALRKRFEEAVEEMQAFRLEEERVQQRNMIETDRLRNKNRELAEGLEKAMQANRDLALQVYASKRLQTHPQGAKILRMLDRSGFQSKEHVDALIEDFRESEKDADDLETVRARVRNQLQGGQEYMVEQAQSAGHYKRGLQNYNGLGVALSDLKHLAGVRD